MGNERKRSGRGLVWEEGAHGSPGLCHRNVAVEKQRHVRGACPGASARLRPDPGSHPQGRGQGWRAVLPAASVPPAPEGVDIPGS